VLQARCGERLRQVSTTHTISRPRSIAPIVTNAMSNTATSFIFTHGYADLDTKHQLCLSGVSSIIYIYVNCLTS
jgi:hypothetical protein